MYSPHKLWREGIAEIKSGIKSPEFACLHLGSSNTSLRACQNFSLERVILEPPGMTQARSAAVESPGWRNTGISIFILFFLFIYFLYIFF